MTSEIELSKKNLLALANTFQNNYDSYQERKYTSGYLVAKASFKLAFDSLNNLLTTEKDSAMVKLKDLARKSFVFYPFYKWNIQLKENGKPLKNPFTENSDFQTFSTQFKDAKSKLDKQPYTYAKSNFKVVLQLFFKKRLPDVKTWLLTADFPRTSKTYELATRWLK